jgi:hypothetical protein
VTHGGLRFVDLPCRGQLFCNNSTGKGNIRWRALPLRIALTKYPIGLNSCSLQHIALACSETVLK